MALETGTYISDLVTTNPAGGDGLSDADGHLRLIKNTVKATFPNVTGAVTPTHTELNYVDGVTSAIQTQIDAKMASSRFPNVNADVTTSDEELNFVDGVTSAIQTQLNTLSTDKAPLASPAFTGNPTAPTPTAGDNDTSIATSAFVTSAIATALASLSSIPSGVVAPYGGTTAPSGWLLCYGQAISRTTYANLFTAISTTYGVGDGSTTFNVPDLRGRVVAGQDDMGGTSANRLTGASGGVDGDVLGGTGGAETHTLTTPQIPSHSHSITAYTSGPGTGTVSAIGNSGSATPSTGNAGGGGAHNNVQPTIILNYIIKE